MYAQGSILEENGPFNIPLGENLYLDATKLQKWNQWWKHSYVSEPSNKNNRR